MRTDADVPVMSEPVQTTAEASSHDAPTSEQLIPGSGSKSYATRCVKSTRRVTAVVCGHVIAAGGA